MNRATSRQIFRLLSVLLFLLIAVVIVATMLLLGLLRGSLPQLDGSLPLPALSARATIERDDMGTVTVNADSQLDAAIALGFVHAQERYFEMDLLRRSAAGELAELFGEVAVGTDRARRVHRLRARSEAALQQVERRQFELVQAYTDGVNAGLQALAVLPWPYLLLAEQPAPWRPVDSLLVGHAMHFDLHDEANLRELSLLQMRRHLPIPLVDAMQPDGSEWDAPLLGDARSELDLPQLLQRLERTPLQSIGAPESSDAAAAELDTPIPGSNNFAVAGNLTADGRALVADDMHLGLRAPNLWFRARLRYADPAAPGGAVDVSGLTLPGLPAVVVGSNGHVAWGFTNSYGDWLDWFRVSWIDRQQGLYATADGEASVARFLEQIDVAGAEPVELEVVESRWGPILHEQPDGSSLALAWTAHRPGSLDLGLARMATVANIDEAIVVSHQSGLPPQNLVVGDSSGRIAWTLTGRLPKRLGNCLKDQPQDPLQGCEWVGWVDSSDVPVLADPPAGRLWTANSRVVDGQALDLIGDGGYDLGARQRQIRDALLAVGPFEEADLLAIQLDDRSLFLQRWWKLLDALLQRHSRPELTPLQEAIREWSPRADADAIAYRVVRGFRQKTADQFSRHLLEPVRMAEGDDYAAPRLPQLEHLLWPALTAQPAELLPSGHASWDDFLLAMATELQHELEAAPGGLAAARWGERNRARICHPLATAVPFAEEFLCMPSDPLHGDSNMPRVQGPDFGASQRMVVAPGHEAQGILHMPGGQSGHPLSPFRAAGHDDWRRGDASPFLPGPTRNTLLLQPISAH